MAKESLLKSFVLFLLVGISSYAQAKTNVAVLEFRTSGVSQVEAQTITDNFITELSKSSKYKIVERQQVNLILKEQGFQSSGSCDQENCEVEIGRLLGVSKVFVGSIGKLGNTYTLSVNLVSVESGEIEKSEKELFSGQIDGLLYTAIPTLANKINGTHLEKPVTSENSNTDEKKPTINQWVKISLAVGTIGTTAMWFYYNNQVKDYNEKAMTAPTTEEQLNYRESSQDASDTRLIYGVGSAIGATAFAVTLFF